MLFLKKLIPIISAYIALVIVSFENKHNYIIELIELQQAIYERLYFYKCNFQLQKTCPFK